MHFPNTAACISSLLMVTASASTPASFEVPGTGFGTAAVPGAPEVDTTTTVFETSTFYVTSAVTVPTPLASTSSAVEIISVPANSSAVTASSCSEAVPPAEVTPTQSLYVIGSQTFVPVTLWENSTTRVIYPQNSTAIAIPTGYPANGTSTVVVTTSVSKTVASSTSNVSATAEPSATVSEVPVNGAGNVAADAVLGLGLVAAISKVNLEILRTVATSHVHLINGAEHDDPWSQLTTLRKHFKVTDQQRRLELAAKYSDIQKKPKNQSTQAWLDEYSQITSQCAQESMPEMTETRAQWRFIHAVRDLGDEAWA
ncbi:uncharacterized protein M421DRAFT_9816 [Didymella exigua CBS 183.55]|uniref:Uncharacterized protein n=1 Tax=Didymella exigua CBS 183.55 TaxID=1150837 RepID=A0A6A5R807_9PLEO|nr:uncharacterized protein M421DRAFT_9816 [Didymella exigua CBS 183.55]KAF1923308.1 hypothetical protein M421DRAFT_9816 [Didymella exigua CBS 183.55]